MSKTEDPKAGMFANLIQTALNDAVTPERIEALVNDHIERLIKEGISDAMRGHSGTGKTIKDAVVEALRVNDLDVPSYGHVVSQILARQIQATVAEAVAGKLSEDMEGLLTLAPKEAKLSELISSLLEDGYDAPDSVHMEIEWTEYSSAYVYISREKPDRKYDNEIRLWISLPKKCDEYEHGDRITGTITGGHVKGSDLKKDIRFGYGTEHKNQRTEFGRWFGFEQKILAMYAVGTVIELDEDSCILDKHDY